MDQFNTVQDLLRWNNQTPDECSLSRAEEIALNVLRVNDTGVTLETVRFLLNALVSYHKEMVKVKRQNGNIHDDIDVWAYDYAQLNAALTILQDVEVETPE